MAATTIFIDDAVHGNLPGLCARTGVPTDALLRIEKPIGGMGAAAWLLLFLGPLGWIALFLLELLGTGRETLTVRLPYSRGVRAQERERHRARLVAGIIGLVALLNGVSSFGLLPRASLVVAVLGLGVAFVIHLVLTFLDIGIRLDASRRWVTLTGVHPDFAAAVAATSSGSASRR